MTKETKNYATTESKFYSVILMASWALISYPNSTTGKKPQMLEP